jgi:hypothetical protein
VIRKVGWLLGVATLAFTGAYTIIYVYRWEWNRALFVGMLFVAVEVGVVAAVVLRRLARVEARREARPEADPAVLADLRASAPQRRHFAWLERSLRDTNVFITVLLGAGVLLSGLTWLVDRVASRTAVPTLERGLARRLEPVAFPDAPLVPSDAELLAQPGPFADDPDLRVLLGPRARPE